MAPQPRPRVVAIVLTVLTLAGSTVRASAQAPPVDPFLGVRILTTGASSPGGDVTRNITTDVTTNQSTVPSVRVTNESGGYADSVLDPIRSFSAAPFAFSVVGVAKPDGT